MEKVKHMSSVNIIRDKDRSIHYIPTLNTIKVANFIVDEFENGVHSFNIIGSYGTGKSSFLWAFNRSISNAFQENFFDLPSSSIRKVEILNIVGEYNSLINYFEVHFSIQNKQKGNQEIFHEIYQLYEKINKDDGLLIINIDEFGKFLEYASKHNPEKEMYFIQQLAEFVNDVNRNILLITTVHQSIDSYAYSLSDAQKSEWKKVKGRLYEITFNEPVEQLLYLASQYFKTIYQTPNESRKHLENLVILNETNHCFAIGKKNIDKLGTDLYPLDIFSAIVLTLSLQRYGQNDRSLFTFLQSSDHLGIDNLQKNQIFDLPKLYDYLLINLYSLLISKHNSDYAQWSLIKYSLERAESQIEKNQTVALDVIKTIGLLNLFSSKGASINRYLLTQYLSSKYKVKDIEKVIKELDTFKIILYSNFNKSFSLFGGTDMDIEGEIIKVGNNIDDSIDFVSKLIETFNFPIITAKETSYKTGTPRLFEFIISENPIAHTPIGEIDGFINLIFNENLDTDSLKNISSKTDDAILYGLYKNTSTIRKTLLDILKTEKVLEKIENDRFAKEALENIKSNQKALLNHYVLDSLYSNKIHWFFAGKKVLLNSKQKLNSFLSTISNTVYPLTPIIKMELINKHKVSGAINSSRKQYFRILVNNWNQEYLGYPKDKFPADKTIYASLIKNKGIHREIDGNLTLTTPNTEDENFILVWKACEQFLSDAKSEEKKITDLIQTLTNKPYKLKQGVIDFLIPTFLFAKRGDFALYNVDGGYIPYITETNLYMITRNPKEFSVKSFELDNLRLNLFNKYRTFLEQNKKDTITNESFIESIRPFLMLYSQLTPYSKNTKKLSKDALKLRDAISTATDPEKTFFESFPNALGYNINKLVKDEALFDDYIYQLQKTISEINHSFEELLNRFEKFITQEILGIKSSFPKYKTLLQKRFSSLKEHQILPSQKTFLLRVNSKLNDRDSWLISISFALLGKPFDRISDEEEEKLKERFSFIISELDNLCEISNLNIDESKEEVYKIDFTSQAKGMKKHLIRVSKKRTEEINKIISTFEQNLGNDKNLKIAVLIKLLQRELDNE